MTNTDIHTDPDNPGPLMRKVFDYAQMVTDIVQVARSPDDWAPLAEFIAEDEFERIGTFMEVQTWRQYTEMMTQWASATPKFETHLRRVAEMPGRVYFEVEERHFRGDRTDVVNSMTVFEFNDEGKIRHLDVYLQQRG